MKKWREGRDGPKEGKPHLEALLCGAVCAQRQWGQRVGISEVLV